MVPCFQPGENQNPLPLDREAAPPPHVQRRQAPPGGLWQETLSAAMSPNPREAVRGAAMTAAGWEPDAATALSVLQDQLLRALDVCPHRPAQVHTADGRTV